MLGHEGEEVGTAAAAVAVAVAGGELQQTGLAIHIAAPGSAASFLAGSRPVVNREKKLDKSLLEFKRKILKNCKIARQIFPYVGLAIGCLSVQPYM